MIKVVDKSWKLGIIFLLFWFGVLMVTGALFSGFHFTDDHDVIRIDKSLTGTTVAREARLFFNDLTGSKLRFRPFYQFHRRLVTAVLGTDFIAWSVYTGLLASLTTFFLFLFMRTTGFEVIESILFAALTLLGPQAAIWWKLGANETLGFFLFSIALYFMSRSVCALRRKNLYNAFFIFFTLLASWSKESFILTIPALAAWKLALVYESDKQQRLENGSSLLFFSSIWLAVKKTWLTLSLLLLICVVELVHIVSSVGTTGIQYAGYEGFSFSIFFKTIAQSLNAVYGWIVFVLAVVITIGVIRSRRSSRGEKQYQPLDALLLPVILAGLIVVPQLVLYMKSGIIERYLLPAVMGYAYLTIVFMRYLRVNFRQPVSSSGSRLKGRWVELFVFFLLAVVCLQQLRVVRYTAIAYAREGEHTNGWLTSIEESTGKNDVLLVITHPVNFLEPSVSLKAYLNLELERKNTCFSTAKTVLKNSGFWHSLNNDFLARNPGFQLPDAETSNPFQAVLLFPGLEETFLKHAEWFSVDKYTRYANDGGYVSYYKLSNE
jgi:hypothetical protein